MLTDNAIVSQSLHYDNVMCLSEEDVSVSWNVDPMPYSQEEYSNIKITLDYICYGNDSKVLYSLASTAIDHVSFVLFYRFLRLLFRLGVVICKHRHTL